VAIPKHFNAPPKDRQRVLVMVNYYYCKIKQARGTRVQYLQFLLQSWK
jgi:hypothetical protein